jgi:hypothetical protein
MTCACQAPEYLCPLHRQLEAAESLNTRCRTEVKAKLAEMELHDDTGDPRDEGYMAAVNELAEFFEALAPLPGEEK